MALSSGEAELYSSVRGISEAINLLELVREIHTGKSYSIGHRVDAVACKGVLLRHGTGQLKHLETKVLWTQERVTQYNIKVLKIPREQNPADMLASTSDPNSMNKFIQMTGGATQF